MRPKSRARPGAALLLLLAAGLPAGASAQAPSGTSDETPTTTQPAIIAPAEPAATPPDTAPETAPDAARELVVATKVAPPFAFRGLDGEWTGIAIELWKQLADELDLSYRLQETTLDGMVAGTASGEYDAAVAALTTTAQREEQVDFTFPFYSTGLGIATDAHAVGGWLRVARNFFTWQFLTVVAGLSAVLLAAGAAIWLFERRRNADQFDSHAASGLGSGFWWAAVTMTTVGYGDKAPATVGGRVVALIWMFTSMIIVASFTAAITASLTVGQLGGRVQSVSDLESVRVGVVRGSSGAEELGDRQIRTRGFSDVDAGLQAVMDGKIDAFVHDRPLLRYAVRRKFQGDIDVLPNAIGREDYGIALPQDSALREPLNRALLAAVRSPRWDDLLSRYLGHEE